ncbi:MAG: hypothetical protein Q4Q17_04970 [Tissierellia bacterium]|nr:hypothetical protein [Tissierellia bacterium]
MKQKFIFFMALFLVLINSISYAKGDCVISSAISITNEELKAAAGKGPLKWGDHVIEVVRTGPDNYRAEVLYGMDALTAGNPLMQKDWKPTHGETGKKVFNQDSLGGKYASGFKKKDGTPKIPMDNVADVHTDVKLENGQLKAGYDIDTSNTEFIYSQRDATVLKAQEKVDTYARDNEMHPSQVPNDIVDGFLDEAARETGYFTEAQKQWEYDRELARSQARGEVSFNPPKNQSNYLMMRMTGPCPEPDENTIKTRPGSEKCPEWLDKIPDITQTCVDGTVSTVKRCNIIKYEVPTGSYSRQTPLPTPPTRNDAFSCYEEENRGYVSFLLLEKPAFVYGEAKIEATKPEHIAKLLNNRTFSGVVYKNPAFQYDSGEVRTWNPTRSDVVLTGLPYKELYSPEIDSWMFARHSQPYPGAAAAIVARAERDNARIARKFGVPSLNIYETSPKGKMEIGYISPIDGKWKTYDSSNRYCKEMYEILIKPEIRVDVYTTYDVYYIHDGYAKIPAGCHKCIDPEYGWKQRCVRYEQYFTCIDRGGYDSNGKWDWWICNEWGYRTRCAEYEDYWALIRCKGGYGNSFSYKSNYLVEDPVPTSRLTSSYIIPPIYETRVRWHYRTGAEVEFHTKTTPLHPQARLTPNIPNADGSIKSGYGVKYSDGYKIETDYDQSRLKYNVWTIRPNRTVNLDPRASHFSQVGVFREDIEYNPDTRKPTASSSSNAFTYIMEKIKGRTLDDKRTVEKNTIYEWMIRRSYFSKSII